MTKRTCDPPHPRPRGLCLTAALLAGVLLLSATNAARAAPKADPDTAAFDKLLARVQSDAAHAAEKDVIQLMTLGTKLARSFTASLATKSYFAKAMQPSPRALLLGADTAMRAGEFHLAAARYKQYVTSRRISAAQRNAAAAKLGYVLIDLLGAEDDAYQFFAHHAGQFRGEARIYDAWFLHQATQREDALGAARLLAAVATETQPAGQEQYYYGAYLEWLLGRVASNGANLRAALPALKQLAAALRANKALGARVHFLVASLEFATREASLAPAEQVKAFEPVLAAADKYFRGTPAAAALQDILGSWGRGTTYLNDAAWDRANVKPQRQAFFVEAFGKLRTDADRKKVLDWALRWTGHNPGRLATPAQWSALAARHAAVMADSEIIYSIPFATTGVDAATIRAQARHLQGLPNASAAVVCALAAGDEFDRVLEQYVRNGLWFETGSGGRLRSRIESELWPAYKALHAKDKKRTGDDVFAAAILRVGHAELSKGAAFLVDPELARTFLHAAHRQEDKAQFLKALQAVEWVPWDYRQRTEILQYVRRDFRAWIQQVRRVADEEARRKAPKSARGRKVRGKLDPKIAKLIDDVEGAFARMAQKDAIGDLTKAPNDFCRSLVRAEQARRQKDAAGFQKAGLAAYKVLRDYEAKRIPAGRAAVEYLIGRSIYGGMDRTALHVAILTDQLKDYNPAKPRRSLRWIVASILSARRNSGLFRFPRNFQPVALKLAAVFRDANLRLIRQNKFDGDLFTWFRGTRAGDRWVAEDFGVDVMEEILKRKLYEQWRGRDGYRTQSYIRSATCTAMELVRSEFPSLGKEGKYPVATWFEPAMIAEIRATGFVDSRYWQYAKDPDKKVVAAAAKALMGMKSLPLGAPGRPGLYTRSELADVHNRVFQSRLPAAAKLAQTLDGLFGKSRFDPAALGSAWFDLNSPAKSKGSEEFFRRLGTWLDRSAKLPARQSLPNMRGMYRMEAKDVTPAQLALLVRAVTQPGRFEHYRFHANVAQLVMAALAAGDRPSDLTHVLPALWRIARDTGSSELKAGLAKLATQMADRGWNDVAVACSTTGLELLTTGLPRDARAALTAIRSRSLSGIGGVIPVKRSDPRYGIYAAQAAFLTGKTRTAWDLYVANSRMLLSEQHKVYRELDPRFILWIIDKCVELQSFEQAEEIARTMVLWSDSVGEGFDKELRAELLLMVGRISLARREFPKARAQFQRVADAKEFADTHGRVQAEILVAQVDRLTRQFQPALERLKKLARQPNEMVQAAALYEMARVKYDQEEYAEARDYVRDVLTRAPDHADARILEGRIQLKLKKLEEPTEIQVGSQALKRFLVPPAPLKVALEDKNLSTVGTARDIEIRVWTDAGDEELISLVPFGDSKTKFRGAMATQLGAPRKGDNILQVRGQGRVYYDFSPRFKTEHRITDSRAFSLTVRSNSELVISSGRILTKEEREELALQKLIRQRLGKEEQPTEPQTALSTVRAPTQVKPGNKIYARVVDLDQSTTDRPDTLQVRATTSSGDIVARFPLRETGPHTGVFEGAIPTASGQALAYASDSMDGREPNFAISQQDYPAWIGLPDSRKPKSFSIDLNDNVRLGQMHVATGEPGRKLKKFLVQTSLNGKEFRTIGSWPKPIAAWDGTLQRATVRYTPGTKAPAGLADFRAYFEEGRVVDGNEPVITRPKSLSGDWDHKLGLDDQDAARIGASRSSSSAYFLVHYRGAFYQDDAHVRTFMVDIKDPTEADAARKPKAGRNKKPKSKASQATPIKCVLAVDGQVSRDPTRIKRNLGRGVHRMDLYMWVPQTSRAKWQLLCNTPKPPYMIPCPMSLFPDKPADQVTQHLQATQQHATVEEDKDGEGFAIKFSPGTATRIVRLFVADFLSDAPAITKVHLTDAAGKKILPTEEDFLSLRKNQVLEIVPGDRVTVSYEDPTPLTAGGELQEAFLTATYDNAEVRACFVEYSQAGEGERQARYIPIRRFKLGDTVIVFIRDNDLDVSKEPDTVAFTAKTSLGKPIQLVARETENHSGIFTARLFPVASKPKRKSEIPVKPGDQIEITYVDRENTDPGIPYGRTAVVEQVNYTTPEVRVFAVTSEPLPAEDIEAEQARIRADETSTEEQVAARRQMLAVRPERPDVSKPVGILLNGPLLVEVLYPAAAQSAESTVDVFVQTSTGRALYKKMLGALPKSGKKPGKKPAEAYDIHVPGTVRLSVRPSSSATGQAGPGYKGITVQGDPYAEDALTDGRFSVNVPVELGATPGESLATVDETLDGEKVEQILKVNGTDEIFVGFRYIDHKADGKPPRWIIQKVTTGADAMLDVMDRRFREPVTGLYVGQRMYFRVIDPKRDAGDDKDEIALATKTSSGLSLKIPLVETFSHSGVFKGFAEVVYAKEKGAAQRVGVLPARYGDEVTLTYAPQGTQPPQSAKVQIYKGSDGVVLPFTKRFKDPDIAAQTQFLLAEAYFELAKRHRTLAGEAEQRLAEKGEGDKAAIAGLRKRAREEIFQGKRLLEEAIRDFPDSRLRAQADYLLANLDLEFANEATDADTRTKFYTQAVTRFSNIVASYPDSPYAPKSQYKKALTYEKMGKIDQACESYVKLSYRYPDNELVAETIARLGTYFRTKGKQLRTAAKETDDEVQKLKIEQQALKMYKTAGEVFSRLAVRFPQHNLAGKTTVLAAQCFMQAEAYDEAVKTFQDLLDKKRKLNPDLVAEAMYWCGDTYMRMNEKGKFGRRGTSPLVSAYRMFKRLTWDYPSTKWAKFARGRLTEEVLAEIGLKEDNK